MEDTVLTCGAILEVNLPMNPGRQAQGHSAWESRRAGPTLELFSHDVPLTPSCLFI